MSVVRAALILLLQQARQILKRLLNLMEVRHLTLKISARSGFLGNNQ